MTQRAPMTAAHYIVEQIGAHDLSTLLFAQRWRVALVVVGVDEEAHTRHFLLILLTQAHRQTGHAVAVVLQKSY